MLLQIMVFSLILEIKLSCITLTETHLGTSGGKFYDLMPKLREIKEFRFLLYY